MKNVYQLHKSGNGMHYFTPSPAVVKKFTKDGNRRVLCTINGTARLHAAIMPVKDGGCYIIVSTAVCRQLNLKTGDQFTADITADDSVHQFDMPEVLKEVLDSDPDAAAVFDSLTPGNKRSLMYLVQKIKSEEKQIAKALLIAERLKAGVRSAREM